MLSSTKIRAEAEAAPAGVNGPRAVPSLEGLSAPGSPPISASGPGACWIDSCPSWRALAQLAVFSPSTEVRRIAPESLRHRDWRDFVGPLVTLLRDSIRYEVKQSVAGPGLPDVQFIKGREGQRPAALFLPCADLSQGSLPTRSHSIPSASTGTATPGRLLSRFGLGRFRLKPSASG